MRGHTAGFGSVDMIARALLEEFPELDAERVRVAIERGIARAANASLDTEGYRVVDLHLARVEASEESSERALILRELSENLEQRKDAERALVVRLSAFGEAPALADLDPLLRLARLTERWSELPLEQMAAMIDLTDDDSPRRLTEIAAAWQQLGRAYAAADCLERVLLLEPADTHAHETLELFYRSAGEWPVLLDLLGRRAVHVTDDRERAELFREMGQIYERELGDDAGALDIYREADQLVPDVPDVLEALARLTVRLGEPEGDRLAVLARASRVITEPRARARAACHAAELAKLEDWDEAQRLFEQARRDDPDLGAAVDGLAGLLRDRGELGAALELLVEAAGRPALAGERSRLLCDAADFSVAVGDLERAKRLYREARAADPANHKAGLALVELCRDTGSLVELAPILDELCRTTEEPARLRQYLLLRSKVAAELGDQTGVRAVLTRVIDLDPDDLASRRELADRLFEVGAWAKARAALEGLLEREDLLPADEPSELHFRVARCAQQAGDLDGANKHVAIALALAPDHRPSLVLRAELDDAAADPFAHAASQLALANIAPPEERAARFAALGDRYVELGDPGTAREMYREALVHRPGDHPLLTKYLGLVAEDGDWSYGLDIVRRLIDTEQEPVVRARYRHLAGMIARDELDQRDVAIEMLGQALEDHPLAFDTADELEALLAGAGRHPGASLDPGAARGAPGAPGHRDDREALATFYYRRLEHVRAEEGRPGERLRLWDHLAELCLDLGRREDAIVAFEVACSLDPANLARRERLADLYLDADPSHDADAIAQHQLVLRARKRRLESYRALEALYRRGGQRDKASACAAARALLDPTVIESNIEALFDPDRDPAAEAGAPAASAPGARPALRPLGNDDWARLSSLDVDRELSALFALVAPAFAIERARLRPPPPIPAREHDVPGSVARVLARVVAAFGVTRPPVFLDREQLVAGKVAMRTRAGVLVPVLLLGRPAVDPVVDDHELAFTLARQLADLRTDRIARLLCPRAGELAQIIELALGSHAKDDQVSAAPTPASRWLTASLHPLELEQVNAIGARLRERDVNPLRAALDWLARTERAADRIGYVIAGNLAACARILEREPAPAGAESDRVLDLVWASVTEEVLAVRGRVEGWGRPG